MDETSPAIPLLGLVLFDEWRYNQRDARARRPPRICRQLWHLPRRCCFSLPGATRDFQERVRDHRGGATRPRDRDAGSAPGRRFLARSFLETNQCAARQPASGSRSAAVGNRRLCDVDQTLRHAAALGPARDQSAHRDLRDAPAHFDRDASLQFDCRSIGSSASWTTRPRRSTCAGFFPA